MDKLVLSEPLDQAFSNNLLREKITSLENFSATGLWFFPHQLPQPQIYSNKSICHSHDNITILWKNFINYEKDTLFMFLSFLSHFSLNFNESLFRLCGCELTMWVPWDQLFLSWVLVYAQNLYCTLFSNFNGKILNRQIFLFRKKFVRKKGPYLK